jgi:tRNA pseudouridine13 synthase
MAANLGADLGVAAQRVNIKATTTEKLGFIGRGEGLGRDGSVLLDTKTMSSELPDRKAAWSRSAAAPRAWRAAAGGQLRAQPEDFWVEEQLSFEPSDAGPHWLLRVEKRAANTRWVAAEIARLGRVRRMTWATRASRIGMPSLCSGSACRRLATADFGASVRTPEFKVLEVRGNSRKLKRGALSGNRFRIRLRNVTWSREQLDLEAGALRAHGRAQLFRAAALWARRLQSRPSGGVDASGRRRGDRPSALSLCRRRARCCSTPCWRGESRRATGRSSCRAMASLDGSGSHFAVPEVDETLFQRVGAFDIHPTGPLWGTGELATQGAVRQRELTVAGEFPEVAQLLESEGLTQERRSLRCALRDFEVAFDAAAATVTVGFVLGRGQFATAVLREICELGSASLEADEE